MIPAAFEYVRASSLAQAIELLRDNPDGAKLLAGGHTLLPALKLRLASPELLIDIGGISEIKGIEIGETHVKIGALTTHAELLASEPLNQIFPVFRAAASVLADPQVRNRGTIGGSLAQLDVAPFRRKTFSSIFSRRPWSQTKFLPLSTSLGRNPALVTPIGRSDIRRAGLPSWESQ